MRVRVITFFVALAFLCPFCATGSDFEDSNTPIEQGDMKTIDQVNDESSTEFEATPVEQEVIKTIDQIDDEISIEEEATPIEQDDIKTIDQLNE